MPYKRSRSGVAKSRRRGWKALPKSKGYGRRNVRLRGQRIDAMTTINKSRLYENNVTTSPISTTTGVLVITASMITDFATLAGVYDQYKINYVTATWVPKYNMAGAVTMAPTATPVQPWMSEFGSAIDYDTGTAPAGMGTLAEYNNFKWTRGMDVHKRVLKPRAQTAIQSGNSFISNPLFNQPWIDCTSPDVQHLGIRYAVGPCPGADMKYDLLLKFNISFKNTH